MAKASLLQVLVPLLAAYVSVWLTDLAKRTLPWLDRQPAPVKQAVAGVVAGAGVWAGGLLGVVLPGDVSTWQPQDWELLLSAVAAWTIKASKQASTRAAP
jgi:NO-binding membrane sensor protein with MHYT domain